MAGPIEPVSAQPIGTKGFIYGSVYQGVGSTSEDEWACWGFQDGTTIDSDQKMNLVWNIPIPLPPGTLKLRILSRAPAVTGSVKIIIAWQRIRVGSLDDPSSIAVISEGIITITWASGDSDQIIETKIDLVAATAPVAGDQINMELTVDDTSFDLAVNSGHQITLVFEE